VRLHNTNIVVFHDDGRVTLHTGGYRTVTTKERINQFISGRVYSDRFNWQYQAPSAQGNSVVRNFGSVWFKEGMEVSNA
jgi:hypothetical protein